MLTPSLQDTSAKDVSRTLSHKKLLTCLCPAGLNGELVMILSMAEAWVKEGKKDFDIFLICDTKDISNSRAEIQAKLHTFDERIRDLNAHGICLTAHFYDIDHQRRWFRTEISYASTIKEMQPIFYDLAVIYPCPAFQNDIVSDYKKFLRRLLPDLPEENFLHSEGAANFKTKGFFKAQYPKAPLFLEQNPSLKWMQPPCAHSLIRVVPEFTRTIMTEFKHYYLLYANPDLLVKSTDFDFSGPSYEDSFKIFTLHSLKKNPLQDFYIFHNSIDAIKLHNFRKIAESLLADNPNLIIEIQTPDGVETVKNSDSLVATGPTVYIQVHPKLSNPEFVGLIDHAQIAALNSAGCFDEALALGKPALILDTRIMTRIENILKIIEIEQSIMPEKLKTLQSFLKDHQELKESRADKTSLYQRLVDYFFNPAYYAQLKSGFDILQFLVLSKYCLSSPLYDVVSQFQSSIDLKQIQLNTDLHLAVDANDTTQVLALLAEGAKITPNYRTGKSLLNRAIEHKNITIVEALVRLERHQDDMPYLYTSHLSVCVKKGTPGILKELLEKGHESVNIQVGDDIDNQLSSLLSFTIACGKKDMVALLLAQPDIIITDYNKASIQTKWGESFLSRSCSTEQFAEQPPVVIPTSAVAEAPFFAVVTDPSRPPNIRTEKVEADAMCGKGRCAIM